jgi:hypothetical protein
VSYQAYLDSIKAKTGKTPAEFRVLAQDKGLLAPGVKAGEVVRWLKEVTHRVAVKNSGGVDPELIRWLRSAYEGAAA